MKKLHAAVLAGLIAMSVSTARSDETKRQWLTGHSSQEALRFGDMSRATKVDTKGGFARLFVEDGGKLTVSWEAKDAAAADTAKKVAGDNPNEWAPIENEQFINLRKVIAIDINKEQSGKVVAVLHGAAGKLGTVIDATAVANIKKLVGQ